MISKHSPGGQDHGHVPALQFGVLLDRGQILDVVDNPVEHAAGQIGVRDFPAAEHQRHLGLVLLVQEFPDVPELELIVVLFGLGPDFDFLDLDGGRFFLGFLLLFTLLVFVTAEIHNPAHRGVRFRGHFHQIQTGFLGDAQGLADGDNTELIAFRTDQPDRIGTDLSVDVDLLPRVLLFFGYPNTSLVRR
jgi:hypothetical protein